MEVSAIMQEINNTQYFKVQKDQEIEVKDVIAQIYEALTVERDEIIEWLLEDYIKNNFK